MSISLARDYNSRQLVAYHPETQAIYVVLTRATTEYYQELARWGSQFNLAGGAECQAQLEEIRELAQELARTIPYDFHQPWGEEIGGESPETWQAINAHSLMLYATYADYLDLEAGIEAVTQACEGQGQESELELPEEHEIEYPDQEPESEPEPEFNYQLTPPPLIHAETEKGESESGLDPDLEESAQESRSTTPPSRGGKLAMAGGFLLGLGILGWAMRE